ncbi:unnamed protein product, partial [Mesorhabditis spiculigera]
MSFERGRAIDTSTLDEEGLRQFEREKRRVSAYKTALCSTFMSTGHCMFGRDCTFAHAQHELRVSEPRGRRHPKYKTTLCDKFSATGYCKYAERCQFIHELRNQRIIEARRRNGLAQNANIRPGDSLVTPVPLMDLSRHSFRREPFAPQRQSSFPRVPARIDLNETWAGPETENSWTYTPNRQQPIQNDENRFRVQRERIWAWNAGEMSNSSTTTYNSILSADGRPSAHLDPFGGVVDEKDKLNWSMPLPPPADFNPMGSRRPPLQPFYDNHPDLH